PSRTSGASARTRTCTCSRRTTGSLRTKRSNFSRPKAIRPRTRSASTENRQRAVRTPGPLGCPTQKFTGALRTRLEPGWIVPTLTGKGQEDTQDPFSCCEAFRLAGVQSRGDSSPPPSLPLSFRGASQRFYAAKQKPPEG